MFFNIYNYNYSIYETPSTVKEKRNGLLDKKIVMKKNNLTTKNPLNQK